MKNKHFVFVFKNMYEKYEYFFNEFLEKFFKFSFRRLKYLNTLPKEINKLFFKLDVIFLEN